jgi:hypothetical protein
MCIGELLDTTISDVNLGKKPVAISETQKNRVGRVVCLAEDAPLALEHKLKLRR